MVSLVIQLQVLVFVCFMFITIARPGQGYFFQTLKTGDYLLVESLDYPFLLIGFVGVLEIVNIDKVSTSQPRHCLLYSQEKPRVSCASHCLCY